MIGVHSARLLPLLGWGVGIWLLAACTTTAPAPQTPLYDRLGGEETLVALSLQVSRAPEVQGILDREGERFFRMRFQDFLCEAAAGPCEALRTQPFKEELSLRPGEGQLLHAALEEAMKDLTLPQAESEELLRVAQLN